MNTINAWVRVNVFGTWTVPNVTLTSASALLDYVKQTPNAVAFFAKDADLLPRLKSAAESRSLRVINRDGKSAYLVTSGGQVVNDLPE